MIVWLRGPSGSGKSTTAHKFLDTYGPGREVFWPAGMNLPGHPPEKFRKTPRLIGYELDDGLFVLGPYHVPGGGLDLLGGSVLKTQIPLVERAAKRYRHVFCESLTSGNVTPIRFLELQARLPAHALPLVMPVLDTNLDECIASIYRRQRPDRRRKVNEEVIRIIGNRVHEYQKRALREGLNAPFIPRETAFETVRDLLVGNGWQPTIDAWSPPKSSTRSTT